MIHATYHSSFTMKMPSFGTGLEGFHESFQVGATVVTVPEESHVQECRRAWAVNPKPLKNNL